ncbi:MAG TPA: hypothetical protein DCZ94_11975 [Lentisphaeria bacterium]|nr:MAG: hypothetical protein A2X48_09430 [Lentisphaerae bacterium GWF2_49_21]HBC87666.1 hypothetical protein [Lentisphaeria bacterium]
MNSKGQVDSSSSKIRVLNQDWEYLYNPNFNPVEFDGIKMQAGLNTNKFAIHQMTILVNSLLAKLHNHRFCKSLNPYRRWKRLKPSLEEI